MTASVLCKLVGSKRDFQLTEYSPKAILFDFDGTLAFSLHQGYEVLKLLSHRYGFQLLEKEAFRVLSTKELLNAMGISLWRLPHLMHVGRKLMAELMPQVQPCEGIPKALGLLFDRGFYLGIVTSNSEENVRVWLRSWQLEGLFSCVVGGGKLLGKDRCIRRALKTLNLSPQQAVYVGDEVRDIVACRRAAIPVFSAAWGLDLPAKLKQANPDAILDHPLDIFALLGDGIPELP